MARVRVVAVREETPAEEALGRWFEKQALDSPANLEAAARLLIGLVSGLLGVLFGVLAVAAEKVPAYLGRPAVRGLGVATVVLLLLGLLAALVVVLPWRWTLSSARPDLQAVVLERLLRRKARALLVAVIFFGLGLLALGGVLVIALLSAVP